MSGGLSGSRKRVRILLMALGSRMAGSRVDFKHPIAEVIAYDDLWVLRLKVPPKSTPPLNENIYGIDAEGHILWQIAPRPHVGDDSPYVQLEWAGKHVEAFNWDGLQLTLDPKTGAVISETFLK